MLVVGVGSALAQPKQVTGKVISAEDNQPIPGANVFVKEAPTVGAITDVDGKYILKNIPSNAKTLVFSFIGFQSVELPLTGATIDAKLNPDNRKIDEVVVVAYGTAKRESVTGAVAAVNAKAIESRPISSVSGILEGQAVGVQVNNSYGEPGADAVIRIRGFSSVNGSNSPLYVLDGVPYSGSISNLNPSDIESISVLKDAASSALYGSRASNGVILITTKRGKTENLTTTITVNQGFYERGMREYERLNANEYMETMWLGYKNSLITDNKGTDVTAPGLATQKLISDILKYNIYNQPSDKLFTADGKLVPEASIYADIENDRNWYDGIERVGYRQDYNVSTTAATDKYSLFFSLGYLNEKGYVKTSDFERINGRANLSATPRSWVKLGLNLSGTYRSGNNTKGSSDDATSYANPFFYAKTMAPIYPVHLHDLTTGAYILDVNGNKQYDSGNLYGRPQYLARHVIWESLLDRDKTVGNVVGAQAYAEFSFLKDFKFTVKGNLDNRIYERMSYNNKIIGDGAGLGRMKREDNRYTEYTLMEQLYYAKTFNDKHNVDVLLGHENYAYKNVYGYGFKQVETIPNNLVMDNFTIMNTLSGYEDNYRTESYLARARYNFKSKYYADASFRRDGSSRFEKNNRWGNFWSVGGSWSISNEEFLKGVKWIDNLRLRASYGEVGNDAGSGYYGYLGLYALRQNGGLGAVYKNQNEALNIRWESSNSFGVAVEGRFLNRINLSVEYFDKRSKDLLFDLQLPLSEGVTSISDVEATLTQNLGSVANTGIEVVLDGDIYKSRDIRWNVGVNLTTLKNEIKSLPPQNREQGIISGSKRYVEGRGIYDYWLYKWAGVDQTDGSGLYFFDKDSYNAADATIAKSVREINGTLYTISYAYAKKDWSGSAIPKVYGSISSLFTYKNFDLSFLGTYSIGGKTLDYSYASLMSVSKTPSALHKDVLKGWNGVPAGMTVDSPNRIDKDGVPRPDYTQNTKWHSSTSDRFLVSSSYFVIKNIGLNYRLPQQFLKKIDVKSASIGVTVENLATFSALQGMNPQQSFAGTSNNAFVAARVYSLGINVVF